MSKKIKLKDLNNLYTRKKKSTSEIAKIRKCSENKINYWISKYKIKKRTISKAIYSKHNPRGDPFKIKENLTNKEIKLLGLGLGLYWGEGHKKNKTSIRLGNTDPKLIKKFLDFLIKIYGVKKNKITFNLIIFSDINPATAKRFWTKEVKIKPGQIRGKITIIKSGRIGNYREKSKYGVIILQYHNKKLRDILNGMIKKL